MKNIVIDNFCNMLIRECSFEDNYVQVYIIKYINSDETQTLVRESAEDDIIIKYKGDGLYTICKLNISTKESSIYYYKEGKFYHRTQEICLQEILDNPKNVKIDYEYYFSVCSLKKCLVKVCQDIFDSQLTICNKNNKSPETYKRDLIWSAINVIEYMVELDQLEEAERLLEQITVCNGICYQNNFNDCGCNK